MNCQEAQSRIPLHLDGELDALEGLALEKHLRTCTGCTAVFKQSSALRDSIKTGAPYYRAPEKLRQAVYAQLDTHQSMTPEPAITAENRFTALVRHMLPTGLGFALGVLATVAIVLLQRPAPSPTELPAEIVASHVRSLMAHHLTDIASSDEHTVKPWFNGKIDFAPNVRDLTTDGFPLLGGRLDYLAGRPVVALVYRHRKHPINLFIWPAGPAQGRQTITTESLDGYNIIHWRTAGMNAWLISDLNRESLTEFAKLLQQSVKHSKETPSNNTRSLNPSQPEKSLAPTRHEPSEAHR